MRLCKPSSILKLKNKMLIEQNTFLHLNVINERIKKENFLKYQNSTEDIVNSTSHALMSVNNVGDIINESNDTNAATYAAADDNVDVTVNLMYTTALHQQKSLHWFMALT